MKMFLLQMRALVRISFLELWRRNDIFGLLVLGLALMVPLSMASPFGAVGASRYLDEVALLLVWGFSLFIALGTGARLFPSEFESRTIYPLLAKPISRGRLLFGKFLGAVCATWSATLFFYVLFTLSVVCRGGALSWELAQGIVLHLVFAALAVAISLFGSLLVTSSANLTLSSILIVGMFFFGRRLPEYALSAPSFLAWPLRIAYAVLPHVEFFDMRQRIVHGWGGIDVSVALLAVGYGIAYTMVVLGAAAMLLRRRRL